MIKAGDCVKFGSYPQNLNEKFLPIEWKVLAIVEGAALLVSSCGLDVRRFDGKSNEWEDSELRRWLNDGFKNMAFNAEEQELIKGEIAVPSWQEAKSLMPNSGYFVRKCVPTPWAKAKGAVTYGGRCFWWTRNHPAGYWEDVDAIGYDGGCYQKCCSSQTCCVRPLIRRRLTPLECGRLQGFPDNWLSDLKTPCPTEEELNFWDGVFEEYRRVVTKAKTRKTRGMITKWLKDPYSDSAAYRLWGNGVALPCVEFVMRGIRREV